MLQAMDSATLPSSCDMFGLKQMGTQKISVVSDQTNGFHHNDKKPDSFVLDIESFSRVTDRDTTPNSRITRNLSRKWSQRGGGEKKPNSNVIANEKDTSVATSSPRAALAGAGTPESPVAVVVGTTDNLSSHPPHHQITITAGNISSSVESKCGFRRNSFRRSPTYWTIDPSKILFFFATLSSMGTLVLICFTLSMSKLNEGDSDALNWPQ